MRNGKTYLMKALEVAIEVLKANPSVDTVSRDAAIKAMQVLEREDIKTYGCKIPEGFDATKAIEALKALPLVTLARKEGEEV